MPYCIPPEGKGFKKGQSGNPGGKSKERVAAERRNAEKAIELRWKLLAAMDGMDVDAIMSSMTGAEILKLLKDAEDRGLGAPKQAVEATGADGGALVIRWQSGDDA